MSERPNAMYGAPAPDTHPQVNEGEHMIDVKQIAEQAREARAEHIYDCLGEISGVDTYDVNLRDHNDAWEAIQKLCRLVEAATLEHAAQVCDVTPPYPFRPSIEAAHAIRALKPKEPR